MIKEISMKARRLCAVILGFVFFGAGVLKLMDPVGTALIINEYFNFFHIGFLRPAAEVIGETFALVETLTGICLITGVFRALTAWVATFLTGGFTILTFILWVFNPAMDCGCFGEAIHLTHGQTLIKNLILCALIFAAFFPYKHFGIPKKRKYVSFIMVSVAVLFFAVYSLMFIPLLELTPFNYSSMIEAAVPENGVEEDEYVSTFIYEKNGKTGVFTLNKLPDSTWTYVETKTIKRQINIDETDYPKLSFKDVSGEYRDSLAADGIVLAVSVPEPSKMKAEGWGKIADLLSEAGTAGFKPLLLAACTPEDFSAIIAASKLSPDRSMPLLTSVYYSDFKTLISLNRSNGGAVYFNDGNLISKWAFRNLPKKKTLDKIVKKESTEVMLDSDTRSRLSFQMFVLYTSALMLLV